MLLSFLQPAQWEQRRVDLAAVTCPQFVLPSNYKEPRAVMCFGISAARGLIRDDIVCAYSLFHRALLWKNVTGGKKGYLNNKARITQIGSLGFEPVVVEER